MNELHEKLIKLKDTIKIVADCFYQQKDQEGYRGLITIIDDITAVSVILEGQQEKEEVLLLNNRLQAALKQALDAMEQQDKVLMADIMNYDVTELLDEIINLNLE